VITVDVAALLIALGSAIVAGVFGYLNSRSERQGAAKVAELNSALVQAQAWDELVGTLREELDRLKAEVATLRALVDTQAGTITALQREVRRLEDENYLLRNGGVPPFPPLPGGM
jgi:uncharacterized protein HemX